MQREFQKEVYGIFISEISQDCSRLCLLWIFGGGTLRLPNRSQWCSGLLLGRTKIIMRSTNANSIPAPQKTDGSIGSLKVEQCVEYIRNIKDLEVSCYNQNLLYQNLVQRLDEAKKPLSVIANRAISDPGNVPKKREVEPPFPFALTHWVAINMSDIKG